MTDSPATAFVFGSPRSGTTLLAKLIDVHPSVMYVHEPISKGSDLLLHRVMHYPHERASIPRRAVVGELIHARAGFLKPPFPAKDFARLPGVDFVAWAWKRLTGRPAGVVHHAMERDRIRLLLIKDGLTPHSPALTELLDAKAVVILRHPCATVNSMLRGQRIGAFPRTNPAAYWSHHSDLLIHLGFGRDDVVRMSVDEIEALRWLVDNHAVPKLIRHNRYRVVTYCHLVRQTMAVIEQLVSWFGLEVTPDTERHVEQFSKPSRNLARRLLGKRTQYYGLSPRSVVPELAWQQELPREATSRILKVVSQFPMQRFWPAINERGGDAQHHAAGTTRRENVAWAELACADY